MARGNITKRKRSDGSVAYRIRFDVLSPDGARSQASETVDTKREAERLLAKRLEELRTDSYTTSSNLPLAEYLAQWLTTLPSSGIGTARQANCRHVVRHYLVPILGHHRLAALTTLHVQRAIGADLDRGLAPATIETTYTILVTALNQAVTWRLVARNVAAAAKRPRVPRRTATVWTADQARTFLAATVDHPYHAMWRLGLDTGMRPGELLALSWGELDFERATVNVVRTATIDPDGRRIIGTTTKTHRARLVSIAPATVATLRAYRAVRATVDRAALLWSRPDGSPLVNAATSNALRPACDLAGVPRIRMHDLRHTNATLLLAAGVPITVVSQRLGHSRVSMTLDRYAHVVAGMQEAAAATVTAIFDTPRDHDVTSDPDDIPKTAPA